MTLKDPPRLLDPGADAPDFVRQALDAGRADRPHADQLARLAQRLPIGVAPVAPVAAIPSALPGAILGAVLGLATVGLHALLTRSEAPPSVDRGSPPAIIAAAPVRASAPERPHREREEESAPPPTGAVKPLLAPAITAASSADPAPRSARAAAPVDSVTPPTVTKSGSDPAPGPAEGSLAAGASVVDTETEIELLQRAQDALGSSPARALELINHHVARFPQAMLGQEREVIAVDALVRLGRAGEARSRAAAFAARFPTSAHLRRLQALVPSTGIDSEAHKDPGGPAPTPR